MIRSFQALRNAETGFMRPYDVQTFTISIPATEVAEPVRVTHMQHEILRTTSQETRYSWTPGPKCWRGATCAAGSTRKA